MPTQSQPPLGAVGAHRNRYLLGSPDALLDHPRRLAGAEPGEPHDDRVLDLAVRMLLEHADAHPAPHPAPPADRPREDRP